MANYFTDVDEETRKLIEACMEGLEDEVKADYLINCLILKYRQGMTVKEIFKQELKDKHEFNTDLENRRKQR